MEYWRMYHTEDESEVISKEKAREILRGYYKPEFVDAMFRDNVHFRLRTPYSDIWTYDDGKVPIPGFYGTIEEVEV